MRTPQTKLTLEAFTTLRNLLEPRGHFARMGNHERQAAAFALAEAMHNFDPTNEVTLPIVRKSLRDLDECYPRCLDSAPGLRHFSQKGLI